jgi:Rieske Fe-S protein
MNMLSYPLQSCSPRNTQLLLISMLVIFLCSCQNEKRNPILVGERSNFPANSVTALELESSFLDPDPPAIGSETPGVVTQPVSETISPIPIFLVHDPKAGIIALYNRDPHLGCRVTWMVERQRFVNPCHGEQYSLTGVCLVGPCPRDLDRFEVIIAEDSEVWISVSKLYFGASRK